MSQKVPEDKRAVPYGGKPGFFGFMESFNERVPLTSLLGIITGEDLFQFTVRFLHKEEPLIPGARPMNRFVRPNSDFVIENIEEVRRLFNIYPYQELDIKD